MQKKILVVEDDGNIADLIRIYLEKDGFEVKIAGDGGSYETAVREVLGRDRRKGMEYWAELLDGYETAAEIPVYPPEPAECSETDIAEILIDRETTERLSELCRKEQVTIGTAVELAWALLIGTASGTDDVVYAKVVSGRDNSRMNVDRIIGLFINAIPVRVRADAETTVASALKALQAQAARSNEYDYCALSDILELTPLGNKLFQSVFAFENYNSGAAPGKDGLKSHAEIFYSKEENIDLLTPSASLTETGELRFRIAAPAEAQNAGGCTLFGRGFGNYNQGLKFKIIYTEEKQG